MGDDLPQVEGDHQLTARALLLALGLVTLPVSIAADEAPCQEAIWKDYGAQMRNFRDQLELTIVQQAQEIQRLRVELEEARKAVAPPRVD